MVGRVGVEPTVSFRRRIMSPFAMQFDIFAENRDVLLRNDALER